MLNMDEAPESALIGDDEEVAKAVPSDMGAKEKPSILEALKHGAEKSRAMFGVKSEQEKKTELSI